MGQYWICINETKKEFIKPHMFGDGAKIMEFSCSSVGTLTAIAILLDDGGLKEKFKDKDGQVVGRWAGDKIRFVGDSGDNELLGDGRKISPYDLAYREFDDISKLVLKIMVNDKFVYDIQNDNFTTIQERLERNY
jgi:hypothetical protein